MSEHTLLLRALRWNAIFSGLSAAGMLLGAEWFAEQFSLGSQMPVNGIAVFLLLFSLRLTSIVKSGRIRQWEIGAIIAGDFAWVLASFGIVVVFFHSITNAGLFLIDLVAMTVLFLALQQIRGLRAWRDGEA